MAVGVKSLGVSASICGLQHGTYVVHSALDLFNKAADRCNAMSCRALAARWNMPVELAVDLAALALYDIVIFADDSGSMAFEENGERVNDLKLIVGRVAEVTLDFAPHWPCMLSIMRFTDSIVL